MSTRLRKRQSQQPIQISDSFGRPKVDILTVVYGKPKFLSILHRGLTTVDSGTSWKWIIVDNCGPDQEELKKLYDQYGKDPRIKCVKTSRNLGFSGGNNFGAKYGRSEYLLLLNSDIAIRDSGWLKAMTDELDNSPTVGIVGAKLLFFDNELSAEISPGTEDPRRPFGKIQHAGVAFNLLGQPYHIYNGWSADNQRVNVRRELNCVTGACLMIRRSLYEKLDGLDEDYTIGNFEDVQICLQARELGYKVVYQPKAVLYHYAGGSDNTATAKKNESIFHIKNSQRTEYDEYRHW